MQTRAQSQQAEQPQSTAATASDISVREKHEVTGETGTHEGSYFEPTVDIYESADALTLTADLPGADPDAIETNLKDNLLTISARVKRVDAKWKPLYREYSDGHYMRQFRLGQEIDQSKITAQFKDGVLTLTLPKADIAKPRRIRVQAG